VKLLILFYFGSTLFSPS